MSEPALALVPAQRDAEDREYFTALFRNYQPRVVAYVRIAMPGVDVDAVAQETFCRALAHLDHVRAMPDPWPWLAVVARNLARNAIRDAAAEQPSGLQVTHAGEERDPGDQVLARDDLRRLAPALRSLSLSQRRLLALLVTEGISGKQAAQVLGVTPAVVRQQLCRMRTKLAAAVGTPGGSLALVFTAFRRLVRPSSTRKALPVRQLAASGGMTVAVGTMGLAVVAGMVPGLELFGGSAVSAQPPTLHISSHTATLEATLYPGLAPARHTQPSERASATTELNASAALAGARASLSKTPTKRGRTASAGLVVSSPVGPITVPVIVNNYGSQWPKPACIAEPSLCPHS